MIMSKKWLVILGGLLILFGVDQILSYFLELNIWGILFAIALIIIGVLILLRPKTNFPIQPTRLLPFGDFNRSGLWTARDEQVWILVGENHLDFTRAVFPSGPFPSIKPALICSAVQEIGLPFLYVTPSIWKSVGKDPNLTSINWNVGPDLVARAFSLISSAKTWQASSRVSARMLIRSK